MKVVRENHVTVCRPANVPGSFNAFWFPSVNTLEREKMDGTIKLGKEKKKV